LLDRLQDYLRRYADGPHAGQARDMLPDVERERRRREFVRSALVGQLRPAPDPPSELERLYRKALLQLWTDGDDAARATLEEILADRGTDAPDQFIVGLAEEDLIALDLRRADRLRADGQIAKARELLERIVNDYSGKPRFQRLVRPARRVLAELPSTTESGDSPGRESEESVSRDCP